MPIKKYKPTSPGRRFASVLKSEKSGIQKPESSLLMVKRGVGGRANSGKITVRHQGGGHKQHYRSIDFHSAVLDKPARVMGLQYDPNRTAKIALLSYASGRKAYMIAVEGMKVGDIVNTSRTKELEVKPGARMAIKFIPAGVLVSSIELFPGSRASIARSAGSAVTVLSGEGGFVQVKMPSGEIRKFSDDCLATVGQVSNVDHNLVRLGKAGRMRHKGVRPRVRGKAMNPVDHPHGGGEGHSPIGMKAPKTPWGKKALGVLTRSPNKASDTLIIRRRKK